jgi:RNA polymerase sigma-70 factor (ECF subfamily)
MLLEDRELVRRCLEGDLFSFDELMRRYERKVYSLAFHMLGNPEDAADLAQEAFLKVYRALPAFRGEALFSTWLFRIVTNSCLDGRRRTRRHPPVISLSRPPGTGESEAPAELPDNSGDPLESYLQTEMQEEIQKLLGQLPPPQRLVLVMRDLEGYSYEEIAAALNISLGTVKSRLNRARLRLRDLYLCQAELFSRPLYLKGKGGAGHEL